MDIKKLFNYIKFMFISMGIAFNVTAMESFLQRGGQDFGFDLPRALTVRTVLKPIYLNDQENQYVRVSYEENFPCVDKDGKLTGQFVKKSVSFQPTKLYTPERESSQLSMLNLEYQGMFFVDEGNNNLIPNPYCYHLKLQDNEVLYSHKFSRQKKLREERSSIFTVPSPVFTSVYVKISGTESIVYPYGGQYKAGFSLDQCEQVYFLINPIPSRYRYNMEDQPETNQVLSCPTEISLFCHSEWLNRGVSPFRGSKQNAGRILEYDNFHAIFSPPTSPKRAESIGTRLANGCAVVNLIYRHENCLITQTYKSFNLIDRSFGSVNAIIDILFMPVEEEPCILSLETPEKLIDAIHDSKAIKVLPTLDDKLEKLRDVFSRQDQQCPMILDDEFLSQSNMAETLAPCVEAFVEGERKFYNFSTKHPHLSPYFLDKLHDIMGGKTRFTLMALSETFSKDASDLTNFVVTSLNIQPESVTEVVDALKFAMDLIRHKPLNSNKFSSAPKGNSTANHNVPATNKRGPYKSEKDVKTQGVTKPEGGVSEGQVVNYEQRLIESLRSPHSQNQFQKVGNLTIRPGQEWKLKIQGKAQNTQTPGHAFESLKDGIRKAKNPEVGDVYLDNGYHKALRNMGNNTCLENNRRPDVLAVFKDKKTIQVTEIQSKSDRPLELKQRNMRVGDQLKSQGITVEVEVKQIPSWDYVNRRPKQ